MTEIDSPTPTTTEPSGLLNTAINVLTSPADAFRELEQRPTKLFPLAILLLGTVAVMSWYFTIIDFAWYIDDSLAGANLDEEEIEAAREVMGSMSQTTFKLLGVFGGTITFLILWVLQAGYLSMASALSGDRFRFTHWFSLVIWTALPYSLALIGMAVTIALSPNGQLSVYDLNPLTLSNLGMQSANASVERIMTSLDLTMVWGITLTLFGYKQWLQSSWLRAGAIVLGPYLLILGIWAYFALT